MSNYGGSLNSVTLAINETAAISGTGSIIHNGTANAITLTPQNTLTIAAGESLLASITNAGTVLLKSGDLVLPQEVTNTATFLLGGTATLDFVGGVTSGAVIQFLQPGGTLEAQAAGSFGAHVLGFAAGDAIDAMGALYGLRPTADLATSGSSGGTLAVTDGTHSASFVLSGSYQASGFHPASDGHGGTMISFA